MLFEGLAVVTGLELVGFVGKQVLDLGGDALKDYVKDFFKDSIKAGVLGIERRRSLELGMGEAIATLTQLFEKELQVRRVDPAIAKAHYREPFKRFLRDQGVRGVLGSGFGFGCEAIDSDALAEIWTQYHPQGVTLKPEKIDWDRIGFDYLNAVKGIIETHRDLRDVLSIQLQKQEVGALTELAGPKVGFDLTRYRESLLEQYEVLKLESLGASKYEKGQINYRTVPLWDVFVAQTAKEFETVLPGLMEIPKEQLRRMQQQGLIDADAEAIWEAQKGRYFDGSPRSILEICEDPRIQYQVILGDPGAGKSTLLRYLAVRWARQEVPDVDAPIPLLIELRRYINSKAQGECKDFLEFIHQGSNWVGNLNQLELEKLLKSGQVLVLFDGLDEVVERQQRGNVLKAIHSFSQNYPQARIVVTSRVIGYRAEDLRGAGFRHFMLQDLDRGQMQQFMDDWHQITYGDAAERERKQGRLERAIERSPAIRELAGNPLLLTLMAILNRGEELPRDRVRLYEKAAEVLLFQWDFEEKEGLVDPRLQKYLVELGFRDKRAMLQQVAYRMQSSPEGLAGNFVTREVLEECLVDYLKHRKDAAQAPSIAGLIIDQLRERNFILCALGDDNYAFIHRTFLEYFCASEIVERFKKPGTPEGMGFEQLRDEVFGAHWQDPTWHEVLRLICREIEPEFAGLLIEFLMGQEVDLAEFLEDRNKFKKEKFEHLFIAADCFEEVQSPSKILPTRQHLLRQLQQATEDRGYNSFDGGLAEALLQRIAMVWGEDMLLKQWLMDCVRSHSNVMISEAAVREIARIYKDNPTTLSWLKDLAQQEKNESVRDAAVLAISQFWKDDSETLPLLKERVQQADEWMRHQAAREIADKWKDDPKTLLWLKDCALHDDEHVRSAAVEAIAKGWKHDPDTLPMLKNCIQNDESGDVRCEALNELAKGWKHDPDTLPMLKHCIQHDDDWQVRRVAVNELAEVWRDDLDTLPMLKERIRQDDEKWVRRVAVEAIARYWKDDPDTLSALKDCVQQDNDRDVCCAAVDAIAKGWKDDPNTLPWLKDCIQQNNNGDIRYAAVSAIVQYWKGDLDTLPLLKERVQQDDDGFVRDAAVRAIAEICKDDPDSFLWLKDLAQKDDDKYVRSEAMYAIVKFWKDDPETLPLLKDLVQQDDRYVCSEAMYAIAQFWKDDPETLPWIKERVQQEDNGEVRSAAVRAIAEHYKDDPDTLSMLKDRVQQDDNGNVRSAAVRAIAQHYKDDPDTLPMLKDRVQQDDNGDVRSAAVEAIAKHYKDNPDTLPMLKDRVQQDDDEDVHWAAVWAIAEHYKDDPETLPWLKDRVQQDDDEDVHWAAVWAIAEHYKDDPDTLPWLKDRVRQDDNGDVRRAAVEAIAEHWKDDPETLPWLKERVQHDDNEDVRRAAVRAIAQHWKEDPETLPMLKDRIQRDDNGDVRRAAVSAIAQTYKADPETLPWLKDRLQQDVDGEVRQAALHELSESWLDEPGIIIFLINRVLSDSALRPEEFQDKSAQEILDNLTEENPNDAEKILQAIAQDHEDENLRNWATQKLATRNSPNNAEAASE